MSQPPETSATRTGYVTLVGRPHAGLGDEALHQAGQRVWQILPLTIPDHTGSPYSSSSSMAGNWLMVLTTADRASVSAEFKDLINEEL